MLPAYPTISASDLIEAAGVFLPILHGQPPASTPRAIHAGWVLETYALDKFFPDDPSTATSDSIAVQSHLQSIMAGNHEALTAFNWKTLVLTIMEALIKILAGS